MLSEELELIDGGLLNPVPVSVARSLSPSLPVVVDGEKATQSGAPQLHPEAPNNIAFYWKIGGGDVDKALAEADGVIKQRLINQRLIPNAMETRAALADYQKKAGDKTEAAT